VLIALKDSVRITAALMEYALRKEYASAQITGKVLVVLIRTVFMAAQNAEYASKESASALLDLPVNNANSRHV
jgi:hypothetical protein